MELPAVRPAGLRLLCCVCVVWGCAWSQYFEDPTLNFKPFAFDQLLRGQYNVSRCVEDLLACWEMMRPDVICDMQKSDGYDFETYCAVDKHTCHDGFGYYSITWDRFIAFTGYCNEEYKDWYDKGKWT